MPVWKASEQVRQNIAALLDARKESPSALAFALKKHRSWMTRFLNRQRHELQLKDLDTVASFFGIATYQLFQPGISALTERRRTRDRRTGADRRISRAQRAMLANATELDRVRPATGKSRHAEETPVAAESPLNRLIERFVREASPLLSTPADVGRQAPLARAAQSATRRVHRGPGGRDDPQPPPKPVK